MQARTADRDCGQGLRAGTLSRGEFLGCSSVDTSKRYDCKRGLKEMQAGSKTSLQAGTAGRDWAANVMPGDSCRAGSCRQGAAGSELQAGTAGRDWAANGMPETIAGLQAGNCRQGAAGKELQAGRELPGFRAGAEGKRCGQGV